MDGTTGEIAIKIRQMRQERGWSQQELAAKCGLSRPTIARVERGDDISTATLRRIAESFGLTLGLVESGENQEHP